MAFVEWDVPVRADSNRSNDLKELIFNRDGLTLIFTEERTDSTWKLVFSSVQAFRSTTEECGAEILKNIPANGGFYKAKESSWLRDLGKGVVPFMENAEHLVVCCYDEIIEVVARKEALNFTKVS